MWIQSETEKLEQHNPKNLRWLTDRFLTLSSYSTLQGRGYHETRQGTSLVFNLNDIDFSEKKKKLMDPCAKC